MIEIRHVYVSAEIPTFGGKKMRGSTSSRFLGSFKGGLELFVSKFCDVLVQQDEFFTLLRSRLVIPKVRNKHNLS